MTDLVERRLREGSTLDKLRCLLKALLPAYDDRVHHDVTCGWSSPGAANRDIPEVGRHVEREVFEGFGGRYGVTRKPREAIKSRAEVDN